MKDVSSPSVAGDCLWTGLVWSLHCFSPQSCRDSVEYHGLGAVSSATGYRPGQPRDSDLVVCAALAVTLTSVSSLLCLHRAGKSAGLPC